MLTAFLGLNMEQEGAKIVSSAILGMDFKVVVVAGKSYVIAPPTIKRLAGAGYWLSSIKGETIKDVLLSKDTPEAFAHALSYMIQGDDGLFGELSNGTDEEIRCALEEAYSMVSVGNFIGLLGLARNVASLIAKPKL